MDREENSRNKNMLLPLEDGLLPLVSCGFEALLTVSSGIGFSTSMLGSADHLADSAFMEVLAFFCNYATSIDNTQMELNRENAEN